MSKHFVVERDDEARVMHLKMQDGILVHTRQPFKQDVEESIEEARDETGHREWRVVADLSSVDRPALDSSGIGAIISLHRLLEVSGCDIKITGLERADEANLRALAPFALA